MALAVPAWAGPSGAAPLKVRGDYDYPPYEFVERGRPTGFNVDVMRAVARTMGLEVDISLGPWNVVRSQLENGEIDALTGMFFSRDRDRKVDFSAHFIVVHHSIFVPKGSDISGLDDLAGKKILVQHLDIMDDFARKELPEAEITTVETQGEALRRLSMGGYDAALLGTMQGLYNVEKYALKNITTVGDPFYPRDYCFAVPEGRGKLLARLNEGLAIIRRTGVYGSIYDKWFGRYERASRRSLLVKYFTLVVLPLLLVLLVSAVWLWTLKRTVKAKTRELHRELAERHRTEEALRESRERYRLIYENILDGYYRTDLEGNILMANPSAGAMLGYGPNTDLVGLNLFRDLGADPALFRDLVRLLERRERVEGFIGTLRRKDGEEMVVEANARLISGPSGLPEALEGVIRDISEQARAARKMEEAKEAAESANRAKSDFLANMSHEIRTPVNGVMLMLQVLQGTALNAEQTEYVRSALVSVKRLNRLLSDILDLSKVEVGRLEVESLPFGIAETVECVGSLFAPMATLKKLDFRVGCRPGFPKTVLGDSVRLQQVLSNIVGNAVKFTQSGSVVLDVMPLPVAPEGWCNVLFVISDTGVGILPEKLDNFFEPFVQAESDYRREHQGAGLGLAITKKLVVLMGGTMAVESREEAGTTFYVTIPFRIADQAGQTAT